MNLLHAINFPSLQLVRNYLLVIIPFQNNALIRRWQFVDEQSLVANANNEKVWMNVKDVFPFPYTNHDAKDWIRFTRLENPATNFAIVVDSKAVGGIGLTLKSDIYRKSAEIGYWLGEPYWNQGIVSAAVKAFTDYAFATFDLCRISAGIIEWNKASARVLEKSGYEFEARLRKNITKNGVTVDELIYAFIK